MRGKLYLFSFKNKQKKRYHTFQFRWVVMYWEGGAHLQQFDMGSNQKHSAEGTGGEYVCIYNYLNGILLQIVESMDIKQRRGKLYIVQ